MKDGLYRQFLDHFADDFFLHDDVGRVLDVNRQACVNTGYSREHFLKLRISDFSVGYSQEALEQLWAQTQPGTNSVVVAQHRHSDGSLFPVEVHLSCQLVDGRKLFFAMARNISDRLRAEQEIRALNAELEGRIAERTRQWEESSRLLEAVMDETPDLVFVKDRDGRYLFCNRAIARYANRPIEEVLGHTDTDLYPHEGGPSFQDADRQVMAENRTLVFEERGYAGGVEAVFQSIKGPYRDAQGRVIGLLGISRDITAMRRAEEKLQKSYETLRQAERVARIGSWVLDLATGSFETSDNLFQMNGADPNGPPLTPDDLQRMLDPDDYRRLNAAIERCIATGESYDVDVRHLRPDGSSFAAHIRGQASRDASGQIVRLSGTVQDVSERKEAQARLTALADNLPSGAIFRMERNTGYGYQLTYVSAGIEALIGVPADAVTANQQLFLDAIHEHDIERYEAQLEISYLSQRLFDCEFRVRKADGAIHWLHCRSAPRRTDQGVVWDGILLDITRERSISEDLIRAKEAAEAAERAKSDFLATMSHEIRTPMNSVIGMTRLALQTDLAPQQRNYLEKIDVSARILLSIISDVLDLSKIEAGKLALEETDFELEAVLDSVSTATAMRAEEKGLEIAYRVAPEVPRRVRGDPLRLGQVLTNLVGNAVKFTAAGEIVVSVEPVADGPSAGGRQMLRFSVRDTGIGVDATQIKHLFQPFTQADSQISRRYGGTGLGLAISRQLVEMMGGQIGVDSVLGQGSEFHFTVAVAADTTAPARGGNMPMRYLTARRVLIVDDNHSARDILLDMVRGFGMDAVAVSSGEAGIAELHAAASAGMPYELVLMDWRMPGMDGLEAARRIRAEENLAYMPAVLMVTAYAREEVQQQVEALGLEGLLIKPITESAMFNTLLGILRASPAAALPEGVAGGQDDYADVRPLIAGRRVLVVDDNAFNREVAADFLALVGVHTDTAGNGIEALAQLDNGQYDAVLMDIHMPEMDGLAATRAIREQPRWAQLPIIALTAQARVEDRSSILAAGMTAHLTKPIDEHVLYRTLARVMAPAAASRPEVAEGGFDLAGMRARFGNNEARLGRVLQGFLRDFSKVPESLQGMLEGADWSGIAGLAHLIKGSVGYLAANELERRAALLETAARQGDERAVRQQAPAVLDGLRALLEQVAAIHGEPAETLGQTPGDPVLSELFSGLDELIRRGDYAAVKRLEQLSSRLAGSSWLPQLRELVRLTEELETHAASEALAALKAALPGIADLRPSATADERPLVLVVDDERLNRWVLAELLQDEYRVLLAKDGPTALLRAQREAGALGVVLLDISMPGIDGYELLTRLKADPRTADIPVIFVTGQSEEEDEEHGLMLGAVDFVSKPIRPAIVRARVRNQIRLSTQRWQSARRHSPFAGPG